jgi:Family of unknown function (DUF6069)
MTSITRWYTNLPSRVALPVAFVTAVVGSVVAELIIAAIAHSAGANPDFIPLTLAGLIPPTVLSLLIAVVVWNLVRTRAKNPVRVMSWLVPIVVLLSWVPDIQLGFSQREAHTTWGEVAVLMVMHLVVSAIGVGIFSQLLPLRRTPTAATARPMKQAATRTYPSTAQGAEHAFRTSPTKRQ